MVGPMKFVITPMTHLVEMGAWPNLANEAYVPSSSMEMESK